MQTIVNRIQAIAAALSATLGQSDAGALQQALRERPFLVVIGSGNSAYPARYLEWLLGRTANVFCRKMTVLEYALQPPRQEHVCLLISKGAKRGDSVSVAELSVRYQAPLFLVCDETALAGDTVATWLRDNHGRGRVFPFVSNKERGFLSIIGTAAAFAVCHELAAAVGTGLPARFPRIDFDALAQEAAGYGPPKHGRGLVLYGPTGQPAAEALAGYFDESLGPMLCYDMKNFTHGVWRGLHEAGPHTVYLVAEQAVRPLSEQLQTKLCHHHECIEVAAPAGAWSVEPFALFLRVLYRWARHCEVRAAEMKEQGIAWTPLSINAKAYPEYMGINEGFDVATLAAGEDGENAAT